MPLTGCETAWAASFTEDPPSFLPLEILFAEYGAFTHRFLSLVSFFCRRRLATLPSLLQTLSDHCSRAPTRRWAQP